MSEKIYALLIRLFPARFRARWNDDSLELIRLRAAHERGFLPSLRLWADLLSDLAVSLPRAYLREEPARLPEAESAGRGLPTFQVLEPEPIHSSAFFFGTLCTISAMLLLGMLARHAGHFTLRHPSPLAESRGVTTDPWATGASSGGEGIATEVIGNANSVGATRSASGTPAASVIHLPNTPPPELFDENERRRVIQGISAILNQRYSDHAIAERLAASLKSSERFGIYDKLNDPDAFASALTRQLRAASGDMHFNVEFSSRAISGQPSPFAAGPWYRAVMRQANCSIQDAKVLPGRVGYIKLNSFPDPEVCEDMTVSALKTVSTADSLVLDLRDNSGGSPAMVMFLASRLFDRPTFIYNPRENAAAAMWTHSPVPGSTFARKPVYVLTSSRTYSAAEQFTYNLKMLHRATLIGETTAGATDTGTFHRIDDHFGIGLRESTVPNPYPVPDWTATGVTPDVPASSADALRIAQILAEKRREQ